MFWALDQVQVAGALPGGQVVLAGQAGQLVQEQPEDKSVCHATELPPEGDGEYLGGHLDWLLDRLVCNGDGEPVGSWTWRSWLVSWPACCTRS